MEDVRNVLEAVNSEEITEFVEYSYSSKDAFDRFEAIKKAQNIIRESVRCTNGHMPQRLIDEYEQLNAKIERIKGMNLNIIGSGR